jgi:glutathione S-transferase
VKSYGFTLFPDAVANRTDGREAARRLTGKSTVPVLELDDGTAIWDSKRIVEWARENPAA